MPIYEYVCQACQHQFETLVRSGQKPSCAACGSPRLERLLSLPIVDSEQSRAAALGAAKRRDAAQGKDQMHEQIKYERSHND
jgi:putative FmdB family regulatory protein